jgi:hypothetical protein
MRPGGIRCRECARRLRLVTNAPERHELFLGALAVLAVSAGAGLLLFWLREIGLFLLLGGLLAGQLAGVAALRASRDSRGVSMEIAASVGVAGGMLIGLAFGAALSGQTAPIPRVFTLVATDLWTAGAIMAAVFGAASRIRHV